jgi:hypothetical protein
MQNYILFSIIQIIAKNKIPLILADLIDIDNGKDSGRFAVRMAFHF